MRQPAPTLQTIADLAGVSRNTVSCALRRDPRISTATRARIHAIARDIGYRPNPLVSALMQTLRQRRAITAKATLAFLHGHSSDSAWRRVPHLLALFEGAAERAAELGFHLDAIRVNEPGMPAVRLTQVLRHRGVRGLLIAPLTQKAADGLNVEWDAFAAAAMGFSLRTPAIHRAGTHFCHAIPLAVGKLRELGYRRIGVALAPESDRRFDFAWEAGAAMAKAAAPRGTAVAILRAERIDEGRMAAWVRKDCLDAVIVAGTAGVREALRELPQRVPEDIGLVDLLAESATDRAATVRREWGVIAGAAVDLVVGQLLRNERGIPTRSKTVLIEGDWDPGNTVRHAS